ncbi:MAG: tRNA pseudouridine(38-40) synthase TruA [Alphaproteobacteria bacterium]|nr:tRNA pseudouridine(38-40) synthase TruA [Alphaproteobacteria bacterium]
MPRYALLIEYDGSRFFGFQRQREAPSVQQFLEDTITLFVKHPVIIHGAGRTDTGVHALGQVVHFDADHSIDTDKLRGCLNFYGKGKGVSVIDIVHVDDDFHARFSALERSYIYVILNHQSSSALMEGRCTYVYPVLDIEAMARASQKLLGTHDFNGFRSVHCQANNAIRTLNKCTVTQHGSYIVTTLRARSFLHNQVRIMMGTLIQIGLGRQPVTWIDDILNLKDRVKSGPTAPPHGLYFKAVTFDPDVFTQSSRQLVFL